MTSTITPATDAEIAEFEQGTADLDLTGTEFEFIASLIARIRSEREQAVRECAAACRQTAREFLSPGYAAIQPSGSFLERFAADECEKACLSLIERGSK